MLSREELRLLNEILGPGKYFYTGFLSNEELNKLYNQYYYFH